MSLFTIAKEFCLDQHFDETKQPDVRLRIHELFQRTKETVARERQISLEVVLLIGLLETQNAAVNLGLGKRENLARSLGLTENAYWKRAQAGRVLVSFPELIGLVKKGFTHISHIAVLAPKITKDNAAIFVHEIAGKTERQVKELVGSINKDGSRNASEAIFDIRLRFTKAQLERLDRAREVLSATGHVPSEEEAILKSIEDLLEKRDPVRKIARAKSRVEKKTAAEKVSEVTPELPKESPAAMSDAPIVTSAPKWRVKVLSTSVPKLLLNDLKTSAPKWVPARTAPSTLNTVNGLKSRGRKGIPAAVVRAVWERDDYCCVNELSKGNRCASKIGLQVDHVRPVSFGQDNRLENLQLLCRQCNIALAEEILGTAVMERYRWIKSRKGDQAKY
jgi:hypothetical protein